MYNLVKAYRSIKNPSLIAQSRTGKPAMVALKIQLDCSTVCDMTLWANIFVRSHLGCGTNSAFTRFCKSHKYFKKAKAMQINRILKISLIWHVKLNQPPKNIRILTKVFCTSGPNLVVLAWTGDELSRGQAQNGVNFDFEGKFDLIDKGQSPPKTIRIFTKVFYTSVSNLVFLAWTGLKLLRGQVIDTWMDGQTQATTIPDGHTGLG